MDESVPGVPDVAPLILGDPLPPWERQQGESPLAYHAFAHFRDQPPHTRTLGAAFRAHKQQRDQAPVSHAPAPKRWHDWATQWGWRERASHWDAEVDRQGREVWLQAQLDARARHAQLAHDTLHVLAQPVAAALDVAKDRVLIKMLVEHATTPHGLQNLLAVVARLAQVIPAMVTMERLALGLTTEQVAVDDARDRAFADKIVSDPDATALAVQLLDRVTQAALPPPPVSDAPLLEAQVIPFPAEADTNGNGQHDD